MMHFWRFFALAAGLSGPLLVHAAGAGGEQGVGHWSAEQSAVKQDAAMERQVERIVASMTLEQKIGQMTQPEIEFVTPQQVRDFYIGSVLNGGGSWPNKKKWSSPAEWVALADAYYDASMSTDMPIRIPVVWGTDAIHGHGNAYGATLFPHNIGLGAAHDAALIEKIGKSVGRQVRATGIHWVFGPTLAVAQDDRWGRTYESFSEDASLVKQYAGAYVKGMQGTFSSDANVVATAKHFMGDGGTEFGKDQGLTKASAAQMRAIHAQGYYSALAAGVQTVMASFNSWTDTASGVAYGKMHGSKTLLTDVLKTKMGFDGFVVSDWNGIEQVPGCSKVRCAQAINAGIDMVMVPEDWRAFITHTLELVRSGEIPVARIDDAVRRIVRVKLRAGLFSKKPSQGAFAGNPVALTDRTLAREAVRKSLVLLKNARQMLPLTPGRKLLVVGKSADSIQNQTGGWSLSWQGTENSNSDFPVADSILAGLREAMGEGRVDYSRDAQGVDLRDYDAVVAVIGETPYAELVGDIEGHDTLRHSRRYPEDLQVLQAVANQGVPVVTVLVTGRPVWANDLLNLSDAFVVAWLPGTEGKGVADVLVGRREGKPRFDFTGRLSFSWPREECQTPLNAGQSDYRPLFALHAGLRYGQARPWKALPGSTVALGCRREAVLPIFNQSNHGAFALHIAAVNTNEAPLRLGMDPGVDQRVPEAQAAVHVKTVQVNTQQDAKQVQWLAPAKLLALADSPVNLGSYQQRGSLVLDVRVEQLPSSAVLLAMECGTGCAGRVDVTAWMQQLGIHHKGSLSIPLACFVQAGAQLNTVSAPLSIQAQAPFSAAFTKIRIEEDLSLASPLRCNQATPWQPSKM